MIYIYIYCIIILIKISGVITPCAMQVEVKVTYYLSHCGKCFNYTVQDPSNKSAINANTLKCPRGHHASVETHDHTIRVAENSDISAPVKTPVCIACGDAHADEKVCLNCFCSECGEWRGTSTHCDNCGQRCLFVIDGKQCGRSLNHCNCDHPWCEVKYGDKCAFSFDGDICDNGEESVDPEATPTASKNVMPRWVETYPLIASIAPHRRCKCYANKHRDACDQCGGGCQGDCT